MLSDSAAGGSQLGCSSTQLQEGAGIDVLARARAEHAVVDGERRDRERRQRLAGEPRVGERAREPARRRVVAASPPEAGGARGAHVLVAQAAVAGRLAAIGVVARLAQHGDHDGRLVRRD